PPRSARPREALLRSLIEARARRTAPRAALAGLALGVLGGFLLLPRGGAVWGFLGLFPLLMGGALATALAAYRPPPARSRHPACPRGTGAADRRPFGRHGRAWHPCRAVAHGHRHRRADDRRLRHHRGGHHDRVVPRGGAAVAGGHAARGRVRVAAEPHREPA